MRKNKLRLFTLPLILLPVLVLPAFFSCDNPSGGSLEGLSGTVEIIGTPQTGNVLVANTTALTNRSGEASYVWKRNGISVGENLSVYYLTVDDVGQSLTVTVSFSGNNGSVTSESTEPVSNPGAAGSSAEGLYAGTSERPVNLNAYTGNIVEKAFAYINDNNDDVFYTLVLASNVSGSSAEEKPWITLEKPGVTVKITGNGGERTITGADKTVIFNIKTGTLIIGENINLAGKALALSSYQGGFVFLEEGAKVTVSGFAISVSIGDGSTFVMSGGEISGNVKHETGYEGGAVLVNAEGLFIMTGGKISGNNSADSGGGVTVAGGTMRMSGGEISGNTAQGTGSLPFPPGGGGIYLRLAASNLYLSGSAKISGNRANTGGGIYAFGGKIYMSGGEIGGKMRSDSSNLAFIDGGGVHVQSGGLYMSGGKISGNEATRGGGVRNQAGQVEISGGEITDNLSLYGGGVSMEYGAFVMSGGASINLNVAAVGGGVCLNGGDFTLSGGAVINGNAAWYYTSVEGWHATGGGSGGYGGGVYLYGGSFTNSGGSVTGNEATRDSDYRGDQICVKKTDTQTNYIYRDADITDTDACTAKQNNDASWEYDPASGFWAVYTGGGE
jgi:hypothetical protein